jgi:hypothetical protein
VTATLLVTIVVEGIVVLAFARTRNKPVRPLLITSIGANLITQSMLRIGLNLFFRDYLLTLFAAEILIWIGEGLLLYFIPWNKLKLKDSAFLSLGMNLSSFALGWFLPL